MTDQLREEVIGSTVAFAGRLLTVRVDTVRLPDGRAATREIVAHPGAVAIVPLLDEARVLLVRQWRAAAGCALLEIPAGTLAPGEDPLDCAARELMEEAGYRPRRLTPLSSLLLAPGYSSEVLHLFLGEDLVPERREADEDENLHAVILGWEEIASGIAGGEIVDAKTITGLLLVRSLLGQRAAPARDGGGAR